MSRSARLASIFLGLVAVGGLSACTTTSPAPSSTGTSSAGQLFPDVIAVEPTALRTTTTSVAVTVSSPYDTEARYADAIRVRSADGRTVYATLELGHDHASEQPFTRTVTGLKIPAGVTDVVVEGHDQVSGWGGRTVSATVSG